MGGGKFGWRTGTGKGKRGNAGTSSGENTSNSGEQKDLSTHAKETDTKTLKNVANSDKAPKELKDAAKKELQNRGEETETKEDKKLRPVGTGTNGPERRKEEQEKIEKRKSKFWTIDYLDPNDRVPFESSVNERIKKISKKLSTKNTKISKIPGLKYVQSSKGGGGTRVYGISPTEVRKDNNGNIILSEDSHGLGPKNIVLPLNGNKIDDNWIESQDEAEKILKFLETI